MPFNQYSFTVKPDQVFNTLPHGEYTRVNKVTAHKAYESGKTVILCPCKLNPCYENGVFAMSINKQERQARYSLESNDERLTFPVSVHDFEWHNCNNTETGTYASYYIVKGEPK